MDTLINIQQPGFSVKITRRYFDDKTIDEFLMNNTVKFVVLTQSLRRYSSNKKITNINDLKKTYKGQTYMRIPIAVDIVDNNPVMKIAGNNEHVDGYAIVSKRALRETCPRMMRTELAVILEQGRQAAQRAIDTFNDVFGLGGYNAEIIYMGKKYYMCGVMASMEKMKFQVLSCLPFVDDKFDAELIKAFDKLIKEENERHAIA